MKTKITIELSSTLHQQIAYYAKSREISVSAIVRLALLDYAERNNIPTAKPAPNIVTTTERARKLSPEDQRRLDAELDRLDREGGEMRPEIAALTTERPRELSPVRQRTAAEQKIIDDWSD